MDDFMVVGGNSLSVTINAVLGFMKENRAVKDNGRRTEIYYTINHEGSKDVLSFRAWSMGILGRLHRILSFRIYGRTDPAKESRRSAAGSQATPIAKLNQVLGAILGTR